MLFFIPSKHNWFRCCVLFLFLWGTYAIPNCVLWAMDTIPDAEQVAQLLTDREKHLTNLMFFYTVKSNTVDASVRGTKQEDDLSMRSTRQELGFMTSTSSQNNSPWIKWTVWSEKAGLPSETLFYAYNGNKYHSFLRGKPNDPRLVPVHSGRIDAGFNNMYLVENYFERMLFLKLNGSSLNLDWFQKDTTISEYKYVKEVNSLGHTAYQYEYERVPGQLKNISTVILKPTCMVTHLQVVSVPAHSLLAEFKIEEIGEYKGHYYPKRGYYRETESKRRYSFEVTAVKTLEEADRKDWFPAWPEGTDVRNVMDIGSFVGEGPENGGRNSQPHGK
ncbi:MAG: hypothetical protein ACRC10_11730 [Thermoguttaceae bacterium]